MNRGFTLIELAIVLFILTLLMAGVMTPLTEQLSERRTLETRRALEELKTAVLGYALSHRDAEDRPHLPCPDLRQARVAGRANDGVEDRLPDGRCAAVAGNLPWITLGMAQTDAWGNRYAYAVAPAYAHAGAGIVAHPAPVADLMVCLDRDCGQRIAAAAVLLAHGRNGLGALNAAGQFNRTPIGADEQEHADGDGQFVARPPAGPDRPGGEFDDMVSWIAPDYLIGRLASGDR